MNAATITPSRSRSTLVGMRCVLAAATWLMPRIAGRLFGLDVEANPAAPYLARLYGAREALMAVELATAPDSSAAASVARRHLAVDIADVAASTLAGRGGYLSPRTSWMTGTTALALVVLGLRGLRNGLSDDVSSSDSRTPS